MSRVCLRLRGVARLGDMLVAIRGEKIQVPGGVRRPGVARRPLERSGRFHVEHSSSEPTPSRDRSHVTPSRTALGESSAPIASDWAPLRNTLSRDACVCRISLPGPNTRRAAGVRRRSQEPAVARRATRIQMPCGVLLQGASHPAEPLGAQRRLGGVSSRRGTRISHSCRPRARRGFHVEPPARDRGVAPPRACGRSECAPRPDAARETRSAPGDPRWPR
jgi:hypothetical protein